MQMLLDLLRPNADLCLQAACLAERRITCVMTQLMEQHAVQVIKETMPALKALGACQGSCWLWPSITQVS